MCDSALSGVPLSNIVIKGNLTCVLELIDIFITHARRHEMIAHSSFSSSSVCLVHLAARIAWRMCNLGYC